MKHGYHGDGIEDNEIAISGYNTHRLDQNCHGGGTVMHTSETLIANVVPGAEMVAGPYVTCQRGTWGYVQRPHTSYFGELVRMASLASVALT